MLLYANEHTFLKHSFDTQPSPCEVKAEAVQCLQVGLALYKHHALHHITLIHHLFIIKHTWEELIKRTLPR